MITLMDAINRNDADMVRKMACTKRILNGVCPPSMGRFQETALHHCVAKNNAAMMAILLEQNGVNVDIVDSDHETPLCFAATIWGTAELVRLLLEAGADPNAERGFGWYPLKLSLTTGDCDITKALLDHPATIVDMSELERLMDKQTRGCNINYLDDETGEQAIARCVKVHELVRSYSK